MKKSVLLTEGREKERIEKIFTILREATKGMPLPMTNQIIKDYGRKPFLILISCLLSLRARDIVTYPISRQLFEIAQSPQEIIQIPTEKLELLLKPLGFYRRKAHILKEVSHELLERFDGNVPSTEEDLLSIKGVGHKTAALVLSNAFNIPAICVDTHVHRLANRLGLVITKKPEQTEQELKIIIPKEYWIEVNKLFVMWGQNICVPISPFCSLCALFPVCPQKGVAKSR